MNCLLVYDIPSDKKRSKIADACLDYGLDRIQYSAFSGKLVKTHQEELMFRIQNILGNEAGNVQLYPVCRDDWAKRQIIDQTDDDDS